mmetsp:Transcript_37261/g.116676  ORF Transcript_37261/g.116676 Transcript_37261/m.116676 type:complete len:295 (-) Transcript_37261:1071-1955(-)
MPPMPRPLSFETMPSIPARISERCSRSVARCCATRWLSDAICCCSSDGDTGRELAGSEGVWSDGVSTGDRSDGARCVEHIVEQDETPAEQSAEALRLEEAPADDSLDFFESDSFEREPLPPESDPALDSESMLERPSWSWSDPVPEPVPLFAFDEPPLPLPPPAEPPEPLDPLAACPPCRPPARRLLPPDCSLADPLDRPAAAAARAAPAPAAGDCLESDAQLATRKRDLDSVRGVFDRVWAEHREEAGDLYLGLPVAAVVLLLLLRLLVLVVRLAPRAVLLLAERNQVERACA